jgi:hypothetical protein
MLMVAVYDVALAVAGVVIVWIDFPYDVFTVLLIQRTVWIDAGVYEDADSIFLCRTDRVSCSFPAATFPLQPSQTPRRGCLLSAKSGHQHIPGRVSRWVIPLAAGA